MSRELDAEIAEKVMGYTVLTKPWRLAEKLDGDFNFPFYSESLDACREAELKCIEKVGWSAYATALLHELGWTLAKCNAWNDDHMGEDGNIAECSWNDNFEAYRLFTLATAEQRCRAMLAAIAGGEKE